MSNLKSMIISVPFMGPMFELCDKANPLAARVRTTNSVRRELDGSWLADNFDGVGFMRGMANAGHAVSGQDALLVGAGGAGAPLAYCSAEASVASLVFSDLGEERAGGLAELVHAVFPNCEVTTGPSDPGGHSLVLSATPVGLRSDDPSPLDVDKLTAEMTVADIITEPRQTPLLKGALEIGCKVQYGQPMMVCQMAAMAEFLGVRQGRKRDG